MSMKVKAMIILVIFCAVLYLPFSVHAANGNIFSGLPIPVLGGNGSAAQDSGAGDQYDASENQYSAQMDQYAANLPKPAVASAAVDIDFMRNHMTTLSQEGQSPKALCSGCHTNRADFCDKCHNYVGINPTIDY
jgi:hypothetical protein